MERPIDGNYVIEIVEAIERSAGTDSVMMKTRDFKNIVNHAPTLKEPKGHWIVSEHFGGICICSNCGSKFYKQEISIRADENGVRKELLTRCPDCDAYMFVRNVREDYGKEI